MIYYKSDDTNIYKKASDNSDAFVEVTGLEPATAWSQTRNATNCATPRYKCKIWN